MKISTGELEFGEKLVFITDPVIGEIMKIRVHNDPDEKNLDFLHLTIRTVDGEKLVEREIGNQEWLFWPDNLDSIDQGINVKSIGRRTANTDKRAHVNFYSDDPLIIEFRNGGERSYIRNIVISVKQTYGDYHQTRIRQVRAAVGGSRIPDGGDSRPSSSAELREKPEEA